MKGFLTFKGGQGSGNFGHDGRPGKVGGSSDSGGGGGGGAAVIEGSAEHTPIIGTKKYDADTIGRYAARFPKVRLEFIQADSPAKVGQLKRKYDLLLDESNDVPAGAYLAFREEALERLSRMNTSTRSASDARIDRILHIRDSAGKTTARRRN